MNKLPFAPPLVLAGCMAGADPCRSWRIKLPPILFLVAVGCGAPSTEPTTPYHGGCLTLNSELPLYQSKVDHNYGLLVSLLIDAKLVRDEQEFCEQFQGMPIRVRAAPAWGDNIAGWYTLYGGIEVNNEGYSLLHEFLHAIDVSRCGAGSAWHVGWDRNGFFALSDRFIAANEAWDIPATKCEYRGTQNPQDCL